MPAKRGYKPETIEKWNTAKSYIDRGMSVAETAAKMGMDSATLYKLRRDLDPNYVKRAARGIRKPQKKAYTRRALQRIEVPVIENIPQPRTGKVAIVIGDASAVAGIMREIQW
jgi:hypothetical protein